MEHRISLRCSDYLVPELSLPQLALAFLLVLVAQVSASVVQALLSVAQVLQLVAQVSAARELVAQELVVMMSLLREQR